MTLVVLLYLAQTLILGIYALFCLSSQGWRRWVGPVGLGIVTVTSLYIGLQSLGRAKPYSVVQVENLSQATVLGIDYNEGVAIYLMIKPLGWNEPFLISVPWTDEKAAEINRQHGEAMSKGMELELTEEGSGDASNDDDLAVRPRKFRAPASKDE